jgi:hypothetical protein
MRVWQRPVTPVPFQSPTAARAQLCKFVELNSNQDIGVAKTFSNTKGAENASAEATLSMITGISRILAPGTIFASPKRTAGEKLSTCAGAAFRAGTRKVRSYSGG